MKRKLSFLSMAIVFAVCAAYAAAPAVGPRASARPLATATFAGGCFWCTEHDFEELPGVVEAVSGYTGGGERSPNYEQVSAGMTRHYESVEVRYDPAKVSYAQLVDFFWHNVDPFNARGQFCDEGDQYRAVIFYRNATEKKIAESSRAAVQARFKRRVVTEIKPAGPFWRAEEYHQDYAKKNPVRYKFYRFNCGRDGRLQELWGKR